MAVQELRIVLAVEDHRRAIAFYRDELGLTELADWSSEKGQVVLLDGGHATHLIHHDMTNQTQQRTVACPTTCSQAACRSGLGQHVSREEQS